MAVAPKSSRVTFIILRHMRRPLLVLITVYAVSMVGWILIPGYDPAGNPERLSFFHAFYFLTYTVTTTGFGELPHPFTDAQRMWGIVSLYAGVIAWFYALGSIVRLVQNPDFRQSLAERQFAKHVEALVDPFVIICGYGNTGALLTRGLSDAGMTVVVIDGKDERIRTVMLRDYRSEVFGLCADARVPEHLIEAGLQKPNCRAVVALTQDEEVNLKIAVIARLLNPEVYVVTQSTSETHEETLSTLGANVHIIDPFQIFATYLGAIIGNPELHTLNQWLAGTEGAELKTDVRPPRGKWILCGFGRMGRWLHQSLEAQGIETAVIEPNPDPERAALDSLIVGRANQENLLKAGIKEAAGIVVATDNDSDNLSILLNARALNPDIFSVVRQNRYRNEIAFRAAKADFITMPSLTGARRMLFLLIAPLLKSLFESLRATEAAPDDHRLSETIERLQATVGGSQPRIWTVESAQSGSAAMRRIAAEGHVVSLETLIRDPVDRNQFLACVPLVIQSGDDIEVMPALSTPARPGDQILFCGAPRAYHMLDSTLHNEYTLRYLITGRDEPRGWLMQWLTRSFQSTSEASTSSASN